MHYPAGRRIFNAVVLILFGFSLFSIPTAPVLAKPVEEPLERPLAVTAPSIGLTLPAQAMIGQNVNFSVTFDNNDTVEGYGPFIEVYLDVTGTDGVYPGLDAADLYDGLGTSSITYTYAGQAIQSSDVWELTLDENGEATHPILRDSLGNFVTITAPGSFVQGDRVVVVRLPFGSFVPSQPPASIDFSVNMSNLADLNIPLHVAARGGYQFGGTPLDDWCCGDDPSSTLSGFNAQTVTPTLLTLTKTNSAVENETATGLNFPKTYTITVSAAPGQTISNLDITEVLPSNIQYIGPVSGATCGTLPSTSIPGGTLGCTIASFTGTATISFPFYVPLRDASSNLVIDPVSGDDAGSCNNVAAVGDWNPIDTRDIGGSDNATGGTIGAPCEDSLDDKSIAVQKGVSIVNDTGATGASPGDTLEYTINFQVSDYFAFQGVYLDDVFSDGQHFDSSFAPVLSVAGNGFISTGASFAAPNFDVSCNYSGAVDDNINCTEIDPAIDDGTTKMVFRVSNELISRTYDGKLIGGCLPLAGTGGADPDCDLDDDGGTTGTITFRTIIQENFTDTFPSGDESVDQGDVLNNDVDIYGDILDNEDLIGVTGQAEDDDSGASVVIARGPFVKSIYALNGNTSFSTPVRITVGDEVTYRLRYTLITSDVEDLEFTDYFPLPIFDVADPNADGAAGPAWSFDTTVSADVPLPGEVKFGPVDTFYNYTVTAGNTITPTVASSVSGNSVTVTYGDFDHTGNISTEIDLLFTVTVTDEPFADGLYLTNQASVSEGSTNAADQSADSIVQVVFTAPAVYGGKSVVATNGDGILIPALVDPNGTAWTVPGSVGPRWTGNINSSWLDSNAIDSDLDNADGGDLVTFAIVLENRGTGINGAFDMVIQDVLDSVHFDFPGGDPANLNLQVYYGNGSGPIVLHAIDSYNTLLSPPIQASHLITTQAEYAAAFFGDGVVLVDPVGEGVCSEHDPNLGNNVIVITYDLQLTIGAEAGETYINTATLVNYAGQEGGTNFVPNGEDFTAEVNIDEPTIAKSLVSTSLENTNNDRTHVVIGEIVTYELVITVPEGTTPNAQVVDTMSNGLAFVDINSVTYATNVTSTNTIGTGVTPANVTVGDAGAGTGNRLTFDFGAITNTNVDNGTDNTITIEYDAVVLNVIGNQSGTPSTQLGNNAVLSWTGGNTTDGGDLVYVIEPTLTTTKAASPSSNFDAGDTINYTITISNANGVNDTDAYDLIITDVIPSGLTYTASTLTTTCTGSSVNAGSAPTLTVNVDQLNKNSSCTVSYAVTVDAGVTPNQTFTNGVYLTWTSLPGDDVTNISNYNTDDDERDGADGVGTGLDNYAAATNRPVISKLYSVVKSLVSTSETHTTGNNVTIGEIIRYQLRVLIPEGDSPALVVQDTLPIGLTFLNDDTAMYWFESDSPFTSDVTGLSLTGLNIASTASPGVDFNDTNISTSRDDITNGDFYNTGTDVNFRLGNLTNNDRDGNDEYIYIQFNVLVDNTVTGSNDAGETRGNSARAYKNENTAVGSNSNSVSVTIVEPQLNIEKSVSPASADAGDTITYTLDITNGSTNASHAFELLITDAINTNLSINSVTITQNDTVNCPDGNPNAVTAAPYYSGQNVTVNVACLAPGDAMQIEVSANVIPTAPSGGSIPNTAYLTWTSLPGTGTAGNPTGTNTPGSSGADDGERNGSGTGANDYADDSTASLGTSVGLNQASIDKSVTPTSYTIGDLITYRLLVTLAEGNTVDLVVDDNIPAGFDFEAYRVITTAAASSGLLSADYVGADPSSPTVTDDGGNGGDVEFDFGTQFTNADNDANNNAFVIELDVRVLDVFTSGNTNTNYDGLTKTNSVTLTHTNGSDSDSVDVTLVEPEITTTKTVALSSGYTVWQAGSVLDYTIRFENTGNSTAFDVTARDDLAQGVSYDTGSMACEILDDVDSSYGSLNVTVDDQTTYLLISGTDGNWHIPVDHKIDCTYTATVLNSVYVYGTHTNTVDADWSSLLLSPGDERTYDDSTAYPVDGTQDTDTAQFTVGEPTISKTVLPLTATIGDTVTFTVVITSPYGTLRDLEIVDTLPAGMRYVTGSVSVINGLSFGAPVVSGQDLTWTLGDTVINSGNATSTFTFQAVVENVIGNQAGGNLENSVDLNYTDAQDASQTLSDTADVDLVEPQMAVTKTNNATATIDAGDAVTYTLTVTNPSTNANNTTAYDVLITDQVYTGTSITVDSITPSGAITGVTDNTAGSDLLSITVDSFPVDAQLVIVYTITLPDTVVPNETIDNAVDLTWTSTASDSNADERNGDDGVSGTLDDYAAEDDTSFDINTVGITKSITATTASHTLGTDLTIGEVATFEILVTFPDGTITAPLAIVDNLPLGFSVVSGTINVDDSGLDSTLVLGSVVSTVDTTTNAFEVLHIDYASDFVVSSAGSTGNVLRITYDAVVNDVIDNADGDSKSNDASVSWDSDGPVSATPVDMLILEPDLQVDKNFTPNPVGLGQTATYTINLSHTAASSTNAMDITIIDVIPAGLTYVTGSIGYDSTNCPSSTITPNDSAAPSLSWTIDQLVENGGSDESCQLTYQVTVDDNSLGETLTNSVTGGYSTISGTPTPDEERDYTLNTDVDLVTTGPELSITKDDGVTETTPGSTLTYTLNYANNGNGGATGVVITETVPNNATFTTTGSTAGWSCTPDMNAGSTCTLAIGNLGVGATGSATFVVVVNATVPANVTQIVNNVSIAGDQTEPTPDPNPNSDTDTDTLTAAVDLTLTKVDDVADGDSVNPGDTIIYTLTYDNIGNRDATGVEIVDDVPTNTTFTTTGSTAGWSCSPDNSAGSTCTFVIGDVDVNDPAGTVYFAVVVDDPLASGVTEILNAATVGGNETELVTTNNTDDETTPVIAQPDLTITKVDDVDPTTPGSTIIYTITYDNVGDQTATGVVITETVPEYTTFNAGLSDARWSCNTADPVVCTITIGTLAVSGGVGDPIEFAVDVDATVPAGVTQIDNTVSIADDGTNGADPTPENNSDDEDTTLDAAPDLNIVKDDGVTIIQAGQILTYTITYNNVGDQDATGVVINETIPTYTTYYTRESSPLPWVCVDTIAGSTCTYTIGDLAAGDGGSIQFEVLVDDPIDAAIHELFNTVIINDDGLNGPDPTDDNQDDETTPLDALPDLTITKNDRDVTAVPGDSIQYGLAYENIGQQDATGVVITETVPDYTTFDAAISDPAWVCDAITAGSTCTFAVGDLDAGDSGSVLFAVLVENPLTAGVESILNDVSIADDGTNGEDPTPGNNVDDEETPVDATSDLTITKDDGVVQVTPGEELTYTIVVTNVQNQTATGVVVTDTLPIGVVFVSASNGGTYDDTSREIIWNLGELAGGDGITLTVEIEVEEPFTGVNPEIVNEVIVTDDGSNGVDPTPENNEDDDRDLIGDSAKVISATNQSHTAGLDVAVGEIVTYSVTLNIAPGLVEDLVFTDIVDQGMAFVGCNQITTDPADVLTLEPGYTLSGLCTMAVVTPYPPSSTNVTDGGRQMVINFGDITNISAGEEDITLTIEYDVVVLNTEANVDGQTLGNQASWTWVGGSLEAEASRVTIVEPDLVITKTVDPKTAYNDQIVTFTVTLNHTEESNSDAFNLEVSDTLPEKLTYVPGSLVFVSGQVPTLINDLNAPILRVGWDVFTQTTEPTVLTYQARITRAYPGAEIENTVTMEWTSLPGDVLAPQSPYNQTSVERSYTPGSNVDIYGVSANALITIPQLPETGFAPGVRTILPQQPENLAYQAIDDLRFAIPKQNLDLPIVGVPLAADGWDLTWLSSQVGYLEGTAYPTWDGNTGLTAHVYNADGTPGPFVNLHLLRWGDRVEVTAFGQVFTYEVRSVERVSPNDLSVLRHEDRSWLTLITCQSFNEITDSYTWRVVVRAVLISVQPIP